jgi:hypothetical protein
MKKVFIAASRAEANRSADEWCAGQQGLRVLSRTEMAMGDAGPSLGEANHWAVTVHYLLGNGAEATS